MVEKLQLQIATQDADSTEPNSPTVRESANRNLRAKRAFFAWFDPNDGPAERRLIMKLDFFILSYAFVGFWILYIDRGILANAYVSGMKEDLKLAMIPATLLVTKYPAHYIVPSAMLLWGVFTLLLYRTSSFSYLAGFRFFVGFLEGPFFCSVHYVLGSWYRSDELVRRAGIFYVSSGVGTMTTGLLAARIYQSLDGVMGLAGWRWMYIVASIMTFPVAIWGYFSFPGSPKDGKRWFLTEEELDLARERMAWQGRLNSKGFTLKWSVIRKFLSGWHFWILVPWNIVWLLGYQSMMQGSYTLWLRAQKQYSVVQVNNYTAISPSIGIVFIISFAWIVDKTGQKAIVPLIASVAIVHAVAKLAFVLYDKSTFGYKWFAVATSYIEVSLSPVNYSIANLACAGDAEERAFVISSMLAIGTAFNSWVPLLAFSTVEAPRYFRGFILEIVLQFTYVAWTVLVMWFVRREHRAKEKEIETGTEVKIATE
ncbi:MFS general substrate transporter [Ophiobolus disseminans]|uniref:MFS general substrate transporter n=1 Tax=Ophiobolus disseminans TaxID=1469910 RepID=A0A6A7AGG2_9PLEO|nr:MFS general substrate transporter [Ophiobolus disseminans]